MTWSSLFPCPSLHVRRYRISRTACGPARGPHIYIYIYMYICI